MRIFFFMSIMLQTLSPFSLCAENIPWKVADKPWNERYGNQRARILVSSKADAVFVHLPWRRHDPEPRKKAIWIVDSKDKKRVENMTSLEINAEYGDMLFQARQAGEYYVYFMPFTIRGSSFPSTVYDKPKQTAQAWWLKKYELAKKATAKDKIKLFTTAKVLAFEARTSFDRMDPMELIATKIETNKLLASNPGSLYLLFPEDRRYPIRMKDALPERWIISGPSNEFKGEALRNEYYVFQVGLYAARSNIEDVSVSFDNLYQAEEEKSGAGIIPASSLCCFNTGGVDWLGRRMKKIIPVPMGHVQPLWIGIDIPPNAAAGIYKGRIKIKPKGMDPEILKLVLKILPGRIADRGDSELWRYSRLRWLNSTLGLENTVTAPYTPLELDGSTVKCLGREVSFDRNGLPKNIRAGKNEILSSPVSFTAESRQGAIKWVPGELKTTGKCSAVMVFESDTNSKSGSMSFHTRAKMEFDGYINFQIALKAERDIDLRNCCLEIPVREEFATYMMGMGCKGGYRPEKWKWKWDVKKHQDCIWLGEVTGGLQLKLKGPNYRWPLVNIHYHRRPLIMPEAWCNSGKGGLTVEPAEKGSVVIRAYGGPRKLKAGRELRFDFAILVTPVKPLNTRAHWKNRYYHGGVPLPGDVKKMGATIINIHHGNKINPFINYPFLTTKKMGDYVKQAHDLGLKVKLYYTIRELTNHVAELWALRSLNNEIYAGGPGGGYAWLCEHLVKNYSPAWHHRFPDGTWCASISQTGLSRWHNYYVEGLKWLAQNIKIDGLYLDEIGYDREIMKRVRRVLDKYRPGSLLDLHSWNPFNSRAGFANCLTLYMEHMPYLDSLWIGEGRNYNESPDYWMVEISGIPFGLFSEMLQGGGNPWRGMLYGMTNRLPWSGNPRPIWKLWDDFGIAESEMIGYWSKDCPVHTNKKGVLATVYKRKDRILICIASWEKEDVNCNLKINWKSLGLDPDRAVLQAPAIKGLQNKNLFKPSDSIPVKIRGGAMLIIREQNHFFISNDGNDNNPGTLNKPFATLKRAQQAIRGKKIKEPVTVFIRSGTYYLPDTFVLTHEDSGSMKAPVLYTAYKDEKPVISGGKRLVLEWTPYKNGIMMAKVPAGTRMDQFFVNGVRQHMARYPNYNPDAQYFNGFSSDAFSRERAKRWSDPRGGFIHAMHRALWGDFHYIITGKDPDGNITYKGGWQNNRRMGMHKQYRFVENIFEELDAPGEWFLNTKKNILYYMPQKGMNLDKSIFETAMLKHLFEFRGTEKKPVRFISIKGLTFRHSSRTFMDNKEPLLRSDWTIYRGGAIFLTGAEDCVIDDCFLDQVGGNAIFVNKYNRRITIRGCRIFEAGANSVSFVGDPGAVRSPLFEYHQKQNVEEMDRTPGPKTDNYPADCLVDNCLLERSGRVEKQTAGVEISMSMCITVRHCSIYDVPRAGINISEGTWGGHIIEFNDVFDTVKETGDHGSFNSWGRDRYWSPDYGYMEKTTAADPDMPLWDVIKPIIIRNNRWRCDHGWDIDLDDGSTRYWIYNNLCLNGGIKNREGFYRVVENNIMVNNTFHPHVWFKKSGDIFRRNIVFTKYHPIRVRKPWGSEVDYNFLQIPGKHGRAAAGKAEPGTYAKSTSAKPVKTVPATILQNQSGRDKHSIMGDALFVNPGKGDYRVRDNSPVLKLGFKNFPMDEFGVQAPRLKAIARTPRLPVPLLP